MRVTDLFLTIPDRTLATAFGGALGPSPLNMMVAVTLVCWLGYSRLVRANAIVPRDSRYAETVQSLGCGRRRVVFWHVRSNAFPTALARNLHGDGPRDVFDPRAMGVALLDPQP